MYFPSNSTLKGRQGHLSPLQPSSLAWGQSLSQYSWQVACKARKAMAQDTEYTLSLFPNLAPLCVCFFSRFPISAFSFAMLPAGISSPASTSDSSGSRFSVMELELRSRLTPTNSALPPFLSHRK